MPGRPKISIITPSYNQGFFLEETIRSVTEQQYPNLQYIVIDGASTDDSVNIIKKHADQIDFWVSEPDKGHAHALNKGFDRSDGEIMAWLNSDDKYTPWALDVVAQIFQQFPEVDWITGFNSWWNKDGVMLNAKRNQKNIYDFLNGKPRWIQQESVFWRRSLWDKVGAKISDDYQLMVDGELWSRFFQHAELYSVDSILSGYRVHDSNRASTFKDECQNEMRQILDNLQRDCPHTVNLVAKKLHAVRRIKKIPLCNLLMNDRLIKTSHLDIHHQCTAYKNIFYSNSHWQKRTLPIN